ncbi:hypothetical protein [Streptomyces pseudogriseolus]|uniref:hypothetical protein n=1 Tax=Streptomyces pseudogriseolus TaxID=36817 RepID=UPI003FA1BAF6
MPGRPFLELPNVVVTPPAAHYSEEAVRTVRTIAAEEAVRVLSGRPARFPVNRLPAESPARRDGPPSSES